MNKSEIKQLMLTIVLCLLTGAVTLFITRHNNKKIGVVDAIKLFNSFNMKIDMEKKAAAQLEVLAHKADSIKQEINIKSNAAGVVQSDLKPLAIAYNMAQNALEEEYQKSNQTINEQVWKRLNPIVDEYGKKENLRVIIGANGMGSILYYDEYYDKTNELIEFVNKKYETGY